MPISITYPLRMALHNADGGRAEACGNCLRILACVWQSRASKGDRRKSSIQIETEVLAHLVDVGNPHCVLFVADLARVNIPRLGPALERHRRFPNRTNAEFVEREADHLFLHVWERGVDGTASWGSGVVATAFVAHKLHGQETPLVVETAGGRLRLEFAPSGEAHLDSPVELFSLSAERHTILRSLIQYSRTPGG